MGCVYNTKGKDSLSLDQVVKLYYESGESLVNSNIYSSDLKSSVETILFKQAERRDEILKLNRIGLSEFITKQNEELLKKIGLDKNRFAPAYQEEKRVLQYIKDKLIDNGTLKEDLDDKTLKDIKKDPQFSEVSEYEKEIFSIIEAEQKFNKLLTSIKEGIQVLIKDNGDYTDVKSKLYKSAERAAEEELINPDQIAELSDVLFSITLKITQDISNNGRPITDIILTTEDAIYNFSGRIDIITITDDGVANIYAIKSSKRNFDKWDSGKRLSVDYQLGFQRALLGQYINVRQTNLTVIPIITGNLINGKLDPKSLYKGNDNNRLSDPKAGLTYGDGFIFEIANIILPNVVHIPIDSDRKQNLFHELDKILMGYKIKTTNREYTKEKIVEGIKKRAYFTVSPALVDEFEKEGNLTDDDYLKLSEARIGIRNFEKYSEADKEKLANEIADRFLKFLTNKDNRNVTQLKSAIVAAVNDNKLSALELSDKNQGLQAQKVLTSYLNGNYRVLDSIEELDSLGIIIIQNKVDGSVTPISISAYNLLSKYNDKYNYLEAEYFKVFTLLNTLYKDLSLDINKIQDIIIFDLEGKTSRSRDIGFTFRQYLELAKLKNYKVQISEKQHLPTKYETTAKEIEGFLRTYTGNKKEEVYNMFEDVRGNILSTNLQTLNELERKFVEEFPELRRKTFETVLDFQTPAEYLYALIKTLILTKHGIIPEGDITGLRDFAIKSQDWFGILKALYSPNSVEFNLHQEKIIGVVGGLKTQTPDKIASKDLFTVNKLITGSISLMRHEIDKRASEVRGLTRDLYIKKGYGSIEQNLIGDYRKNFRNMWLEENGKISNKWRLKNPYSSDLENTLKDDEREYVIHILFHIQRQIMRIPIEISSKINPSSIETIKATTPKIWADKIIARIENGEYFRMPLIRSQLITRHSKAFSGNVSDMTEGIKSSFSDVRDFIDPREMDPSDVIRSEKIVEGYHEMYEIYGTQSVSFIAGRVDAEPDKWEIDLDRIAISVIQEKVRKKYADNLLPVINAYVWVMKLTGARQNQDISKALKYVEDRIKLAILDQPLVDKEYEDVITAASVVKTFTTAAMLGFRPAILVKELAIGLFKGSALAATQFFGKDQFTFKDYFNALKEMMITDKSLSLRFNKLEALNHYYGFANMDINSYAKKVQTNRRGLFMGLSPYMYSMNTIPDYYNRLSLFIAKMMHDGSYDAHSVNENGLIYYDPTKDKRFEYYFQEREKYKTKEYKIKSDSDSIKFVYLPSKTDLKYNQQRNLYLLTMKELNDTRRTGGESEFNEGDMIDQAYSEVERSSYKSYTDTVYGYYDKEQSPSWHYTWYGLLLLQFMQFWPGKMDMWFGKPNSTNAKITGQHRQMIKEIDGKKIKMWRIPKYDENGDIYDFDLTEENTGDPALEWTGLPHEGIMYSIAKTIHDTTKGLFHGQSLSQIKEGINNADELRLRRVMYGLADGVLMYLIFNLFKMMYNSFFGDGVEANPSASTRENKDFFETVNKKIINESMLWNNTYGALRSQPAFWTYSLKALGDVKDVFEGDKTIKKALTNIKALEFIDTEN